MLCIAAAAVVAGAVDAATAVVVADAVAAADASGGGSLGNGLTVVAYADLGSPSEHRQRG